MNAPVSNTHRYTLNMQGLSCNGCVNKVRKQMQTIDANAEMTANDDKSQATVSTTMPINQVIEQFEHFNYQAQLATASSYQFDTQNVNCGGCANKLTKAVNQLDSEAKVSANIEEKTVTIESMLSHAQLAQVLSSMNYLATQSDEPQQAQAVIENKAEQTAKSTAQPDLEQGADPATNTDDPFLRFNLSGVTCASCVRTIEQALNQLPQVQDVAINFGNRTATVSGDISADQVEQAVKNAGYGATQIKDELRAAEDREQATLKEYQHKLRSAFIGTGAGLALMATMFVEGSMHLHTFNQQIIWFVVGLFTLWVMAKAGSGFFVGSWNALKNGHANMDTLIALGTGAAWLYSMTVVVAPQLFPEGSRHLYFEASLMIIGLINLGQALEVKARGRTSKAINRLLDLQAKTALRMDDEGNVKQVPIEDVEVGDKLLIRSGERIPVDGTVLSGNSSVDESMLTGEPMPVSKQPDSELCAGTINGDQQLIMQTSKVGRDTLLSQIVEMVSKAQNSKPPISHLADRISAVFVPVVVVLALITAAVWYLVGPQPTLANTLIAATSVLIIACPCALGLATPISTMIGVGKAAEVGGLIRNGDALQTASRIDTVILDKTGTITEGKPSVVASESFSAKADEQLLSLVYELEQGSTHPLAEALKTFSYSASKVTKLDGVTGITTHAGLGVSASYNGQPLLIGNLKLMREHNIELADSALTEQHSTATMVYFAIGDQLAMQFAINDPIKADSAKAIAKLQQQGIEVIMLTGDNARAAQAIAHATNVDQFYAELMPEDKLAWVEKLQQQGKVIGMVGDGINDAPALAKADVGFAIGHGTDVAIESADITLMRGSLMGIAQTIAISKATISNIKQNLFGAFIYNAVGIPIAAGVLYPLTGLLLNPIVAGVAMSLSSVTVVSNANRLRLFEVDND